MSSTSIGCIKTPLPILTNRTALEAGPYPMARCHRIGQTITTYDWKSPYGYQKAGQDGTDSLCPIRITRCASAAQHWLAHQPERTPPRPWEPGYKASETHNEVRDYVSKLSLPLTSHFLPAAMSTSSKFLVLFEQVFSTAIGPPSYQR